MSDDRTITPSEAGALLLRRAKSCALPALAEFHALSALAACEWYGLDPDERIPHGHPARCVARAATLRLTGVASNALARAEDVDRNAITASVRRAVRYEDATQAVVEIVLRLLSRYTASPSRRFVIRADVQEVLARLDKVRTELPESKRHLGVATVKLESIRDRYQ
ncbi:MAG TPA: hypothetical protein VJ891_01885 [Casimicrobiaceae bacterium]|nr:hypothetical protein [Casimicrobiaceae bacterium]